MTEATEVSKEDAEMEAAFNDATSTVPVETQKAEVVEEKKEVEEAKPEVEVKEEAPAQAQVLSEDQVKLLSAIPKLEQLLQRVDKVDGQYGEIKRILEETKKASATPQSAASFEASEGGDLLDREFQELAPGVQEKIDKAIAKIPLGLSRDQLEAAIAEREEIRSQESVKALDEMHPDRLTILESPEWKQYLEGLPSYRQVSIMNSNDLYYVASELSQFKEHLSKQTAQAEKSKSRIEKAITPTGARQTTPSTLSEEEAAEAAFNAQFT